MSDPSPALRLDKWLWFARFFKTRAAASRLVAEGGVRVNGRRVSKASASVRPGDVLTFVQGRQVRVVEVAAIGARRGPAPEAQGLYTDRSPPPVSREAPVAERPQGSGRPTKKARRDMDARDREAGSRSLE